MDHRHRLRHASTSFRVAMAKMMHRLHCLNNLLLLSFPYKLQLSIESLHGVGVRYKR